MRRSADDLVRALSREGLRFSAFSLEHIGPYSAADAEWNYKDVPHLRHVHALVEAIIADVDDSSIATVNLQKVGPLRIPLALYNYSHSPSSQVYFTAAFVFVLVIETKIESIEPLTTKVTTTYHVGATPLLQRASFPLIRWALKRNYDNLMSGDIPMRHRRGQLRSKGFSYRTDGAPQSFERTMNISGSNLVFPPAGPPVRERIGDVFTQCGGGPLLWGEDDHRGLRVQQFDGRILVFPRLCSHEGASLDDAVCVKGRLSCPWHGRVISPLAEFDAARAGEQTHRVDTFGLTLRDGDLHVEVDPPASRPLGSDRDGRPSATPDSD